MTRGRRPPPTYLRLLQGNPQRRPINTNEPQPEIPAEFPEPPPQIDGYARDEWYRIGPELHRMRLLPGFIIVGAERCGTTSMFAVLRQHPAVFNAEDASKYWDPIPGVQCKNLFLRNKKGDRHYLVVVGISRRVDLKDLVKVVGDDRLSFGSPDRLMAKLGLTPGSVSPFGVRTSALWTPARDRRS